jgi:hypothetical protein
MNTNLPKFNNFIEEMMFLVNKVNAMDNLIYSLTLLHEEMKAGKVDLDDVESELANLLAN